MLVYLAVGVAENIAALGKGIQMRRSSQTIAIDTQSWAQIVKDDHDHIVTGSGLARSCSCSSVERSP